MVISLNFHAELQGGETGGQICQNPAGLGDEAQKYLIEPCNELLLDVGIKTIIP